MTPPRNWKITEKARGPGGQHPNIVGLKGATHTGQSLHIGLEYCPGGDIGSPEHGFKDRFSAKTGPTAPPLVDSGGHVISPQQSERTRQLIQASFVHDFIAGGLSHMHQNSVSHLDVKDLNAFIGADGVGKVADFGNGFATTGGVHSFSAADRRFVPQSAVFTAPELLAMSTKNHPTFGPANQIEKALSANNSSSLTRGLNALLSEKAPTDPSKLGAYQTRMQDSIKRLNFTEMDKAVAAANDPNVISEWIATKKRLVELKDSLLVSASKSDFAGFSPSERALINDQGLGSLSLFRSCGLDPYVATLSTPVDCHKADVWSLGMTLMRNICGDDSEPFRRDFMSDQMEATIDYADPNRQDSTSRTFAPPSGLP